MALKLQANWMSSRRENSKLVQYLKSFDYWQILSLLILQGVGLLFIYSTGVQSGNDGFFSRQLFWVGVSIAVYFVFAHVDVRFFEAVSEPFFIISLLLLVVVLIFGTKISGARRWLDFGLFNFQPSELAKLSLIVILAKVLSNNKFNVNDFSTLAVVFGLLLLPFILIFIEPDLGSALLLIPCCAAMVLAAGLSRKWICWLLVVFVVTAGLLFANEYFRIRPILRSYHKARIMAFINPENAPSDMTYQQRQSELAVGSGGLLGKGLGKGTQHALGYLPQSAANNDFIFSVIAEEWGFFKSAMLIVVFFVFCLRILMTSYLARDKFSSYLSLGIVTLFFTQIFVNIGVNIGLAPVTGLVLPFVSYGGSFLLIGGISAGIVQSVWRNRGIE